MIYRVEIRKDGAIASCTVVESALKNGGRVCYVEADTPAEACTKARNDWARLHARLSRPGKCSECERNAVPGRTYCVVCRDRRKAQRQEREQQRAGMSEEEWAAHVAESKRKAQANMSQRGAAANAARTNAIWDDPGYVPRVGSTERTVLRQCLRAYDRSPEHFRAWLVSKLACEEATAAE